MKLPEGWFYDENGKLHLDPPMYDSFRKAIKAFKKLEKTTDFAVLAAQPDKKSYAVFDESPVISDHED